MLSKIYFEKMKARALSKLEGDDGLRAWIVWAKKEIPREYAMLETFKRWQEAESNLRIADVMIRTFA